MIISSHILKTNTFLFASFGQITYVKTCAKSSINMMANDRKNKLCTSSKTAAPTEKKNSSLKQSTSLTYRHSWKDDELN